MAIAPNGVLVNKADNVEITTVLPTDGTEYALQAFIENAGENSVWSYDEDAKALKLWNTAVYNSLDL